MNSSRDFAEALLKARDAECVGCGMCCRKAPCTAARRVYGPVTVCPALKYDSGAGRYFCELCQLPGSIGEAYREELSIGAGCCSPLFNQDRENIPVPESEPPKQVLDKQLRAFFHAMGRQGPFGCSGDRLWLLIHSAANELGLGKDWIQACFRAVREERSSDADAFMGEIPVEVERKA